MDFSRKRGTKMTVQGCVNGENESREVHKHTLQNSITYETNVSLEQVSLENTEGIAKSRNVQANLNHISFH